MYACVKTMKAEGKTKLRTLLDKILCLLLPIIHLHVLFQDNSKKSSRILCSFNSLFCSKIGELEKKKKKTSLNWQHPAIYLIQFQIK